MEPKSPRPRRLAFAALAALAAAFVAAPVAYASIRYYDTDRINEGVRFPYEMTLSQGNHYWIEVISSQQDADFDLEVFSRDRRTSLASSAVEGTSSDHVIFAPAETDVYYIVVTARATGGWYEFIVLNLDGL